METFTKTAKKLEERVKKARYDSHKFQNHMIVERSSKNNNRRYWKPNPLFNMNNKL
jgi:hypothetical protein